MKEYFLVNNYVNKLLPLNETHLMGAARLEHNRKKRLQVFLTRGQAEARALELGGSEKQRRFFPVFRVEAPDTIKGIDVEVPMKAGKVPGKHILGRNMRITDIYLSHINQRYVDIHVESKVNEKELDVAEDDFEIAGLFAGEEDAIDPKDEKQEAQSELVEVNEEDLSRAQKDLEEAEQKNLQAQRALEVEQEPQAAPGRFARILPYIPSATTVVKNVVLPVAVGGVTLYFGGPAVITLASNYGIHLSGAINAMPTVVAQSPALIPVAAAAVTRCAVEVPGLTTSLLSKTLNGMKSVYEKAGGLVTATKECWKKYSKPAARTSADSARDRLISQERAVSIESRKYLDKLTIEIEAREITSNAEGGPQHPSHKDVISTLAKALKKTYAEKTEDVVGPATAHRLVLTTTFDQVQSRAKLFTGETTVTSTQPELEKRRNSPFLH